MAQQVIDFAMQIHGGAGLSDDFMLSAAWTSRARAPAGRRARRGAPRHGRPPRAREVRPMSRVLVTGAASGLGAALARAYAERGDDVLATDLAIDGLGRSSTQLRLDITSDDDWAAARDWVEEHWGGLDVLVNNAGVAGGGRIDVAAMEEWSWITEINLFGAVRGTRTFVPGLQGAALRHDRQRGLAGRSRAPRRDGVVQRGEGSGRGVHRDRRPRARGVRRALRGRSARRTSGPT